MAELQIQITWKPKMCESCGTVLAVWSFFNGQAPSEVPQSEAVFCDGCDTLAILRRYAYSNGKKCTIGDYTVWRGCACMDLVESLWDLFCELSAKEMGQDKIEILASKMDALITAYRETKPKGPLDVNIVGGLPSGPAADQSGRVNH